MGASPSRAGRMSGEWNGAETASRVALRAPRSRARATARSIAPLWPASTVCAGPFRLATAQTSSAVAASEATPAMASGSMPMIAAMAPTPTGTASCMSWPRRRTRRRASANPKAPAATSAEYSPRLCPAMATGASSGARTLKDRWMAIEVATSAGWVFSVSPSSSSGPSQQSRERGKPRAASASAKAARASGTAAAHARPMPTFCAPWPGKTNAILLLARLIRFRLPAGRRPGASPPGCAARRSCRGSCDPAARSRTPRRGGWRSAWRARSSGRGR